MCGLPYSRRYPESSRAPLPGSTATLPGRTARCRRPSREPSRRSPRARRGRRRSPRRRPPSSHPGPTSPGPANCTGTPPPASGAPVHTHQRWAQQQQHNSSSNLLLSWPRPLAYRTPTLTHGLLLLFLLLSVSGEAVNRPLRLAGEVVRANNTTNRCLTRSSRALSKLEQQVDLTGLNVE